MIIKILDLQRKSKWHTRTYLGRDEVNFAYKILGTGSYLPGPSVENERFSEFLDTSDEWISTRTGISRRHLSQGEPTWKMGLHAATAAVEAAGIDAREIGLIIVSTLTPDYTTPILSCILQKELGAVNAFCFDVNEACTGFIQCFDIAMRYLMTSDIRHVLIVSAESLSKLVDYSDRRSCVLFGDGAGAVVLSRDLKSENTPYEAFFGADGELGGAIVGEAFPPARHPFMPEDMPVELTRFDHPSGRHIAMQGQEVYRFATTKMPFSVEKVLARANLSVDQIDRIIPHQANDRILQSAAKRLGIPSEKMVSHLRDMGNTSSASIPICLDQEVRAGRIKRGEKLIFAGFGGGLTYGALLCEY